MLENEIGRNTETTCWKEPNKNKWYFTVKTTHKLEFGLYIITVIKEKWYLYNYYHYDVKTDTPQSVIFNASPKNTISLINAICKTSWDNCNRREIC